MKDFFFRDSNSEKRCLVKFMIIEFSVCLLFQGTDVISEMCFIITFEVSSKNVCQYAPVPRNWIFPNTVSGLASPKKSSKN